ncbi:MAG: hypothetical protein QW607_04185 [Desulfurococcaceae archaeon]
MERMMMEEVRVALLKLSSFPKNLKEVVKMDIFDRIIATVNEEKMEFMIVGVFRNEVVELLNSKLYLLKYFDFTGGWEVWIGINHGGTILDFFTGKAPLSRYILDTPPKFYIRDKYDDFNFVSTETPSPDDDVLDELYNLMNFYLEPAPALFPFYSTALQLK